MLFLFCTFPSFAIRFYFMDLVRDTVYPANENDFFQRDYAAIPSARNARLSFSISPVIINIAEPDFEDIEQSHCHCPGFRCHMLQ